jgi:hypothetical protein
MKVSEGGGVLGEKRPVGLELARPFFFLLIAAAHSRLVVRIIEQVIP